MTAEQERLIMELRGRVRETLKDDATRSILLDCYRLGRCNAMLAMIESIEMSKPVWIRRRLMHIARSLGNVSTFLQVGLDRVLRQESRQPHVEDDEGQEIPV